MKDSFADSTAIVLQNPIDLFFAYICLNIVYAKYLIECACDSRFYRNIRIRWNNSCVLKPHNKKLCLMELFICPGFALGCKYLLCSLHVVFTQIRQFNV